MATISQLMSYLPRRPLLDWSSFRGGHSKDIASASELAAVRTTTSGRAAIFHALRIADLPKGSIVLLPTYHCPTMVAPAVILGMKCEFYTLGADGLPDLERIPEAIAQETRVMLVAHLFGVTRSLKNIRDWCDRRGVLLIEDCAHALYGQAGERPVGAWGDYATASLSKFLPVPEGGILASSRHEIPQLDLAPQGLGAQVKGFVDVLQLATEHGRLRGLRHAIRAIRSLRRRRIQHCSTNATATTSQGSGPATVPEFILECDLDRVGRQALALTYLLRRLPQAPNVLRRRSNYQLYAQRIRGRADARPLIPEIPIDCVPYVFPLWVDDADRVYHALRNAGVPVFRWDRLWPGTPHLEGDTGMDWSKHVLQLLCHQSLEDKDIDWVCGQIDEQLNR